ncbi:conserved exported hypothetical protein [Candidatus Desulfosporosinus infrequens]|uniref:Uncharacterized protein n=1 Tax=Candidatus Desulfosporosinus infrequens TaxID=2043169 RepID=A0A2U3KGB0_9FIRM|nr:conserved exported hypothetical protein [Candidatus Desulfosporosinus infrequens]
MNIRMFKKADLILIVGLVLLSGLILAWNTFSTSSKGGPVTAVITQNGTVLKTIDLASVQNPESLDVSQGFHQVILVEKGRICFSESDCRDKICVKSGWLTKIGDKAVCMPSKTVITLIGDHQEIDSIAY